MPAASRVLGWVAGHRRGPRSPSSDSGTLVPVPARTPRPQLSALLSVPNLWGQAGMNSNPDSPTCRLYGLRCVTFAL